MKLFNRNSGENKHRKNTEIINYGNEDLYVILLKCLKDNLKQLQFQHRLELIFKSGLSVICLVAIILMLSGKIQEETAIAVVGIANSICLIPLSQTSSSSLDRVIEIFNRINDPR
jgi:hypothetical protein